MPTENPIERDHPVATLQDSKLRAEIEKLELECQALKSPFKRLATWVPVVVALISVAGLVMQWQTSNLRAERAAFEAARELATVQDTLSAVETELQKYRTRMLISVVENLDKTREALFAYKRDWRQITVFRDGNRAVEELLTLCLSIGLLPTSLIDDLERLREHYREWLKLYNGRFPDGIPRKHEDPVFVYSFPSDAEQNIKACVNALMGGARDCDQ